MRIKTTTYSDVQQKPCQFYWHGLLHVTIAKDFYPALDSEIVAQTLELLAPLSEDWYVDSEQTILFWSFITVVGSGLLFSWGLWVHAHRRAQAPGSPGNLRTKARAFHERVGHFTLQVRTLDEHANEYTSIFKSDDWDTLVETVSQLEQVDREIQDLVRAKRFDCVAKLLNEFQEVGHTQLDSIQASLDSYRTGRNWEEHVHGMLKRVVQNLEAATHETREITRTVTSRKRQPTLVTLADVKKTLLEDEVLRRSPPGASKGYGE
jgi:hypothetical protein